MKADTPIFFRLVVLLLLVEFMFRYQEPGAGLVEANMSKIQYLKIPGGPEEDSAYGEVTTMKMTLTDLRVFL